MSYRTPTKHEGRAALFAVAELLVISADHCCPAIFYYAAGHRPQLRTTLDMFNGRRVTVIDTQERQHR